KRPVLLWAIEGSGHPFWLSPSGDRLVTALGRDVWEIDDNKPTRRHASIRLSGSFQDGEVSCLPSGNCLVTPSGDFGVVVWDLGQKDATEIYRISDHQMVAFSRDGRTMASVLPPEFRQANKHVQLWSWSVEGRRFKRIRTLGEHPGLVTHAAFTTGDGEYL